MSTPPPLGAPTVVIPCSAGKRIDKRAGDAPHPAGDAPLPAGDLYTGPYHRLCRRAAEAMTAAGGTILIVSAAHGFLALEDLLMPYEMRMGDAGCVDAARLAAQAADRGLHDAAILVALGGRAYVDAVTQLRLDTWRPLDGCRGIGEQRGRLSRIARSRQPLLLAEHYATHAAAASPASTTA